MELIRGKKIADNILSNIKSQIDKLETKPTLAVFLIGENEASEIYVELKRRAVEGIGMGFKLFKYPVFVAEDEILSKIKELNEREDINGIIVQLPLPDGLDKTKIINAILPKKDVDGFCRFNQERFFEDKEILYPVFPKAIMKMVDHFLDNADGKKEIKVSVVCKSDDFGKMMQKAFSKRGIGANYIFCDDLDNEKDILNQADIIITACGKRKLINSKMTKNGVMIIDGGIIKEDKRVFGDVDIESFENFKALISPVPGGVGPVTVACLLENTFLASRE